MKEYKQMTLEEKQIYLNILKLINSNYSDISALQEIISFNQKNFPHNLSR